MQFALVLYDKFVNSSVWCEIAVAKVFVYGYTVNIS